MLCGFLWHGTDAQGMDTGSGVDTPASRVRLRSMALLNGERGAVQSRRRFPAAVSRTVALGAGTSETKQHQTVLDKQAAECTARSGVSWARVKNGEEMCDRYTRCVLADVGV